MNPIRTCQWIEDGEQCTHMVEGRTDYCGTHNHIIRKSEREHLKPVKKPKRIPKESKKRKVENKEYSILRTQFLIDNPECKPKLLGCTRTATQVHHTAKRGKNLNNVSTWMPACDNCHKIIERIMSAEERREKGYLQTV